MKATCYVCKQQLTLQKDRGLTFRPVYIRNQLTKNVLFHASCGSLFPSLKMPTVV